MRVLPHFLRRSLRLSVLVGLGLVNGVSAQAPQQPANLPPTPTAADSQGYTGSSSQETPAIPGTVEPSGAGSANQGASPSVWSKVPPAITFTRLGGFWVLPTGPGYYSFCDFVTDNCREKPPIYSWPPFGLDIVPFYDNNFRYLDDPNNTQFDYMDLVKRIHFGDCWLLSVGGEERMRYANEVDSRLSGRNNTFELLRSRLYGDLWYGDRFRIYAEYIDARTYNEDLPPLASDVNKSDFLNLFVDVKIAEFDNNPVYVRGGRQELNYGSQRLISQTDWPNANRTFDGVKALWHSEKLDVDAFGTRPVIVNPTRFDSENDKATFAGFWSTYRPAKGQAIDLYYLYLDNATPIIQRPARGTRGGFDVNTVGSRYYGDYNVLLWDFEGMYQFGEHGSQATSAGAATTGLGVHFANAPMNPNLWVYYDFASGNHDPGHDHFGTFNQLFPNGHAYFGWTDLVGRQNIQDLNFQAALFPTKWIIAGLQYHILRLDASKDALYNA
ncbi:MAG: alginate export family protein, partial [Gemmataceae bacterium]